MTDNFNYDDTWTVIDELFSDKTKLIEHHLTSFNNFVEVLIPQTLKEFSPQKIYYDFDEKISKFKKEIHINFKDTFISKPVINENNGAVNVMYPNEARLRKLTYSGSLSCNISIDTFKYTNGKMELTDSSTYENIIIGKIPIMVGSKYCVLNNHANSTKSDMGECKFDEGGYFIVLGSEKVIIPQEVKCPNKVYIFPPTKNLTKCSKIAEITSITKNNLSNVKPLQVKIYNRNNKYGKTIKVDIKRFKSDIPLFIIFRALNIISDKSIIEHIVYDIDNSYNLELINLLEASLEEASHVKSKDMALNFLSKYSTAKFDYKNNQQLTDENRIKYVEDILLSELLPHVGPIPVKKAYFLGYMVNKLLRAELGYIKHDDRDSFMNKRVESTGHLLNTLFRTNFNKLIKDMRSSIEKDIKANRIDDMGINIEKKIKQGTVELGMKYGLATGNWGVKGGGGQSMRQGIAQVLNRLSYLSTISYLRRINAPIDRSLKDVKPRFLHNTQFGTICPSETPEGHAIGIVKNMAMTAFITIASEEEEILNLLEENEIKYIEQVTPKDVFNATKVFVNGDFIGIHDKPNELVEKLKHSRRNGIINIYISICWNIDDSLIFIYTDAGRLCRPLYIIKENEFLITNKDVMNIKNKKLHWDDLLCGKDLTNSETSKNGVIEYIDIEESDTIMVAFSQDDLAKNSDKNNFYLNYTHCELHASLMYGVLVSNIPFANYNQAPRNQYQAAMGKQAIGIFATNYRKRIDTVQHVLYYPQKALICTRPSKYVHSDEMPSGTNAIVAISSYTGYNQEDSLMVNQSSLDRGLFVSSYYRLYSSKEQKNQVTLEEEKFCKPEKYNEDGTIKTFEVKPASYDKLDPETGIVREGEFVTEKDVIIGKVIPLKQAEGSAKFRDNSTTIKKNESGFIDRVYINKDADNYTFVKVNIRAERIPEIGDKFASRHGQKGTIGMTYKHEDMPFSKNGLVPDIIVNPHAIPSRMTVGQLIECILGKVSLIKGCETDATSFNNTDVSKIGEILQQYGYNKNGTEVLYNGRTGEQMETQIFIGPTYYQRLKHMVVDKVHSRATGPYNLLTRQPAEGRSRDGGLRIGEMERDCLLSHGMTNFLNERLFTCSDKYFVYVCDICGMIACGNKEKNLYECKYCDNNNFISKVKLPYACKLFFQELMSMGIITRIESENYIGDKK
jgi:DNA-directed RNA polymerase II subunit RPB2